MCLKRCLAVKVTTCPHRKHYDAEQQANDHVTFTELQGWLFDLMSQDQQNNLSQRCFRKDDAIEMITQSDCRQGEEKQGTKKELCQRGVKGDLITKANQIAV